MDLDLCFQFQNNDKQVMVCKDLDVIIVLRELPVYAKPTTSFSVHKQHNLNNDVRKHIRIKLYLHHISTR